MKTLLNQKCATCKKDLDTGRVEDQDCGGDCLACMGSFGDPYAAKAFLEEIERLRAALLRAQRLMKEALPKFNWGASALDANAIALLNEVPGEVDAALKGGK